MRRILKMSLVVASLLVVTTFSTQTSMASGYQPQTATAAKIAAKAATGCSISTDPRQVGSAKYGIVNLSFGPDSRCGYWQVWGYTGSAWRPLFAGLQNTDYHPLNIPGRIDVCKGADYTNVRSGPSLSASVVGRVSSTLHTTASQVILTKPATAYADGLGWYKISWQGRAAWVGSTRVIDPSFGCRSWNDHDVLGY